ncbi:MAG: 23S rRNA (pseudouridine(1915)-N(3))-methyltransferase RlmH [Gammaproteobacteria bacterium HGW-Gammaproteobacteria-8]|nr:MAG: 23S rRNA (pseudouridine(1915)-N(3))-methyltransferase RlmH [Gammaproteobacteria bacterium HGW-Gammaproteobacteria-8]
MDLRVIAIGRPMPVWVSAGWNEYARRMPPQLRLELLELPAARGPDATTRAREAEMLLARCPERAVKVALDEGGQSWSTRDFASRLEAWQMNGDPVCFLVGGASGHDPGLINRCAHRWSLSRLTFPHMLVRVILAEQIYRAWTCVSGHPYHRD